MLGIYNLDVNTMEALDLHKDMDHADLLGATCGERLDLYTDLSSNPNQLFVMPHYVIYLTLYILS